MEIGSYVLVTTEHRGVFAGELRAQDGNSVTLTNARNCIYWPKENKGFLGLAESGPLDGARIGAKAERLELHDVTSVSVVTDEARKRWEAAPWG